MVEVERAKLMHEILYAECFRISCPQQKGVDDQIKLWRETNDGMYWVRKVCKPTKGQFGI